MQTSILNNSLQGDDKKSVRGRACGIMQKKISLHDPAQIF